jgi:Cu/Ag efflux pump CusA
MARTSRQAVAERVELPMGYRIDYGGQFESAAEARRTLLILGAVVVVGIFAAGGVISVASLVGFIALFGIATGNGVMRVTHIRHLVEEERVADFRAAVRRGALERLSPILMTALSAGLALVPLALAGGEPGSELQTPMAIVMLWGLLSSTALNMLVVPALYLRFGQAGRRRDAGKAGDAKLGVEEAGPPGSGEIATR